MCLAPLVCDQTCAPDDVSLHPARYRGFALFDTEGSHRPRSTVASASICRASSCIRCLCFLYVKPSPSPPEPTQANPHSNGPLWRQQTLSNLVAGHILQRVTTYLQARKGHVPATRVLVGTRCGEKDRSLTLHLPERPAYSSQAVVRQ